MTTSSLLSGITSSLSSTYSVLANAAGTSGVTLETIAKAQTNTSLTTTLNGTFASYIQSNFKTLDKDGDGVLSSSEMSNMTSNMMATGLTQSQLSQLGTASGMSAQTLSEVLEHFADIDTNGDGKVTNSEINAYKLTSAKEKKETEFRNKFATDMSLFYGDENASSEADSSSLLSYKYLSENK